ncbi:MAG: hypothetical protein RQ741_12155 [Wenzhouxiangellaceae bacterium]|nr:hypothetical protein [Wenzhouxiangellaceae bacterium]
MIKQLLITLLVATVVVTLARMKRAKTEADKTPESKPTGASSGKWQPSSYEIVGYCLATVMIVATAILTYQGWRDANQIVRVEVVDTRSGDRTVYQVRRKALGDREFRTVDGRIVSLGASDRMERIDRPN